MAIARVVKLGGSLLSWPGLKTALPAWLAQQTPGTSLIIAGGGPLANGVRQYDAAHGLGEEAAHWLALRTMQLNAHLAAALWPDLPVIGTRAELAESEAKTLLLDAWRWLAEDDRGPPPVEHSWQVTSDSIAAWVAGQLGCCELVLLKSWLPEEPGNANALSRSGYLDQAFARYSHRLATIRCVALSAGDFPEFSLLPPSRGETYGS